MSVVVFLLHGAAGAPYLANSVEVGPGDGVGNWGGREESVTFGGKEGGGTKGGGRFSG